MTAAVMNQAQLIKTIGSLLADLDLLRGSFEPADAVRPKLDALRRDLDRQQQRLARGLLKENSAQYRKALKEVRLTKKGIQATLNRPRAVARALALCRRVIELLEKTTLAAVAGK